MKHILAAVVLAGSTAYAADYREQAANDPYFEYIENEPSQPQPKLEHAQAGQLLLTDSSKAVAAPIVLKAEGNQEAVAGAVVVEPTPQPENALEILRNEMQQIQAVEQEKHQKEGWFKSTNKRFVPESMTFFVAIGLVTYNSMWIKSHGDPLAMERHILSLKDPIAHLSFYAFMVANGFYIDIKTKNIDPITKAQMMRRLSYQGMAVGSLASSLASDLGQSGKMCVDYWIMGHNDEKSVAACNQAWKQWTVRNKFQQYFPQIIAMWASQAATEIIDANTRKAFGKITFTETAKNLFSRKVLVNTAKKIVGVDALLTFSGGTWSMKAIRWVGKLTQFSMFVSVDHAMSPFTYRPLNNLLRPLAFDFDALAINNYISAADKINWDDKRLPEANKVVCSVRNPECLDSRIAEEIESFGVQMQQWREHLNSDAEMDIAGWMEMTKKLLNQVNYAFKFYKSFTSNMFETLNIGSRIQSGELKNSAAQNISLFPFRKLPLYGVGIGEYKTKGGSVEDLYLIGTAELERKQKEHIDNVVVEAEKAYSLLEAPSLEKFKKIISKLKSNTIDEVGSGLIDINQILGVNSLQDQSNKNTLYSTQFMDLIGKLRLAIGNPMPVVYPFAGFSQAFAANSTMSTVTPDADFSLWSVSKKYFFNKESDLMMYKVFCGDAQGSLDKTTFKFLGIGNEVNIMAPQFNPPRLLNASKELDEYCSKWRKTRELKVFNENLYGQKIGNLSMYYFLLNNFNYNAIGDYRNKENAPTFEKWWLQNGRRSLDSEFKNYDSQFKKLTEITYKNIFNQKGLFNSLVDHLNQSKYLKSNIKENLQFETNFYLQIISRALDSSNVSPLANKDTFLEKISKSGTNEKFTSVGGAKNLPEVQKVVDLFNAYYDFIKQDKIIFDQYISHSKKIDGAINDLLVLAGLKTSSKGKAIIDSGPSMQSSLFFAENGNPAAAAPGSATVATASADASSATPEVGLMDFSPDEKAQVTATPSATGTETSDVDYKDNPVKPNLRQKAIASSVQGLRAVESEIRRFIRMKVALSQGLELDTEEFMKDFNNSNPSQNKVSAPVRANPFGQRSGG